MSSKRDESAPLINYINLKVKNFASGHLALWSLTWRHVFGKQTYFKRHRYFNFKLTNFICLIWAQELEQWMLILSKQILTTFQSLYSHTQAAMHQYRLTNEVHDHATRSRGNIFQERCRIKKYQDGPYHMGAKHYNHLPSVLKLPQLSLGHFKGRIRAMLLESCPYTPCKNF